MISYLWQEGGLDEADLARVGSNGRDYKTKLDNGMIVSAESHEMMSTSIMRQIQDEL